MEQPREPKFYPNEQALPVNLAGEKDTLQSIDATLKRIEKLLDQMKDQLSDLGDSFLSRKLSPEQSFLLAVSGMKRSNFDTMSSKNR